MHAQDDKEKCMNFFLNLIFPGEAKMCLGFMSFRAPPSALKQKKSPNIQLIITLFQAIFKFIWRHLWVSFQNNWTCFVFIIGMLHLSRFFIFNKFPTTYAFHLCVEYDKSKWIPLNKIWFDVYIRQILCKNACICVPF